ncbi:class I SAM-dependent methyltransferase [Longispora sp. NPDC051575]|uniref:class I SAM-dependent methyltransferase n=1 Tax=Longispora sp. NPDC051575 TaxID=3154943 RepID=UPI0034308D66
MGVPSVESRRERVAEVTGLLTGVFAARATAGPVFVVVDGQHAAEFADRLVEAMASAGQHHARLTDARPLADEDAWRAHRHPHEVVVADGPRWRTRPPAGTWDVVIYLRTAPRDGASGDSEHAASVVLDYHDPGWPVIRHLDAGLADRERWYLSESRAFFAVRAHTWDTRFGEDLPAYARAVAEAGLRTGDTALDLGCGTGRALPMLRAAVGPRGTVLGLDVTPAMLDTARERGRAERATLLLGDARRLPLAAGSVDAVFAAGLVNHLPEPRAGLAELARVTRPGGTLVVFHPSGRAALAARHGRTLRPDEPLARPNLEALLEAAGWRLTGYEDAEHQFLAVAARVV